MSEKKAQLQEYVDRARELADKKDISEDETKELEDTMSKARDLQKVIQRDRSIDEFTQTISEGVTPERKAQPGPYRALGPAGQGMVAVAERKGFEAAVEAWKAQQLDRPWGFDLKFLSKADVTASDNAVDEATAEVNSGTVVPHVDAAPPQYGAAVQPFYYPGIIEPATRAPMVADLFAQGSTDSNLVRLVKEHVTVDGAKVVGEGQPYGLSKIEVRPHDFPVRDIATLLPVTEDILMDIPAMSSYLSMRLSKFVQLEEEDQLLSGNGSGSNLEGIFSLEDTTEVVAGADNIATGVMKLLATVYSESFIDPTWVLMSPLTWAEYVTDRETASGGLGAYLAGGASGAPTRRIWDLPITVSPAVPDDKIVVGNPSAGMIFRNGGLRVESSTGFQSYFGEGLVAIRAKVRTAFAVFRPQAIGILSLGS